MKLIIFDLDGTLLNTIDDLGTACNHALKQTGYPLHSLEEYKHLVGNGINKLIKRSLPAEARNEETVMRVRRHFVPYYDEHCCCLTHPYEGMKDLIAELLSEGYQIAVASNKYDTAAKAIVRHYFPHSQIQVYGQRENVPLKPDPSVVNEIINNYGVEKKNVIFVGDSDVDMQTAHNADVCSIGVSWGFRGRKELENAEADYVADNTQELKDLIIHA